MAKRELTGELDSVFEAMQEVYNDCDKLQTKVMNEIKEIKAAADEIFEDDDDTTKKNSRKVLKLTQTSNIIHQNHKLLNDIIDKKIKMIAIHEKIVSSGKIVGGGDGDSSGSNNHGARLTSADLAALKQSMLNEIKNSDEDYNLKH